MTSTANTTAHTLAVRASMGRGRLVQGNDAVARLADGVVSPDSTAH